MEQGFWGAVIGATLGSIIVGGINVILQRGQHKHALDMQQKQWDQESDWRKEDRRDETGRQIAAWDNARTDQKNEREHALLIQLQTDLARFSRASRVLYENNLAADLFHRDPANAGRAFTPDPRDMPFEEEFNAMRVPMLATISRVRDDTLREAAYIVHQLDVAMAVSSIDTWRDRDFWGGADPILQQVERQEQVMGMAGRLIRGERVNADELMPMEHQQGAFRRRLEDQQQRAQERRNLRVRLQ